MGIEETVRNLALRAREASRVIGQLTEDQRNGVLLAMAQALNSQAPAIVAANEKDMEAGRKAGMSEGLLDRLMLNADRVDAMADALRSLAQLPDPVGRVLEQRVIDGGMEISRVSVPLGVVAMVYEARPNVTVDAAGICLKSGNACVLRGGSAAAHSNEALADVLRGALASQGLPEDAVSLIRTTDRSAADVLMSLHGIVDVLIPRGGAGLIRHCVETSKVPVIETGTGNCHVYVHETADFEMAKNIILNAKTQRTGVCNACESLLVDESIAKAFLPDMIMTLAQAGVTVHGDSTAQACAMFSVERNPACMKDILSHFASATADDWGTEYLSMDISVKCVNGIDEAVRHINEYGTGHSECIVANSATQHGQAAIETFLNGVDAAAVYANVSTRFTDGGCFGLGAEIGISTQKLHVRGPFALEALTSYKYIIRGCGQVRG